jgi:arylformamidase
MDRGRTYLYLSHVLSSRSPVYPGNLQLKIKPQFSFAKGDSFNQCDFEMCNHIGTHVDLPRHFNPNGKAAEQMEPAEWVFQQPVLLDIPKKDNELIGSADLQPLAGRLQECDLVLIRTGFEEFRNDGGRYTTANPSLAVSAAEYIIQHHSQIRAIGLDVISAGNVGRVDEAVAVHRLLLGYPKPGGRFVLIIEDMALRQCPAILEQIIALPLLIEGLDGAPCTVLASCA